MPTQEELVQAAEMLRDNCRNNEASCHGCLFDSPDINCPLSNGKLPDEWKLPNPRRWTDADIALAKALKDIGGRELYRDLRKNLRFKYAKENFNSDVSFDIPAFRSLKPDETISLDEIIGEEIEKK